MWRQVKESLGEGVGGKRERFQSFPLSPTVLTLIELF